MSTPFELPPDVVNIERVRASCPEHGPALADQAAALLELQTLVEAEMGEDDIVAYAEDNPALKEALEGMNAVADAQEVWNGNSMASKIRRLLGSGDASAVRAITADAAEAFLSSLGRAPKGHEIPGALMEYAMAVATNARLMTKSANVATERGLVNQFGVRLLLASEKSTLCSQQQHALMSGASLDVMARTITTIFNAQLPDKIAHRRLSDDYIPAKLRSYFFNVAHVRRITEGMRQWTLPELPREEVEQLRHTNTEFAKNMLKMQRYGIKPVAFPFSEVRPDTDIVFHDFRELDLSVRGSQPTGIAILTNAETPALFKVSLDHTAEKKDGVEQLVFPNVRELLALDSNGDLYNGGVSPDLESIPLREVFAGEGRSDLYEQIRSVILARLFDTIAPATVVERIQQEVERARFPYRAADERPNMGDIVRRLMLPRLQYLQQRTQKQVRREFDEALAEEAIEVEKLEPPTRQVARHGVSGHLRKISPDGRPGKFALERARKYYNNPNYEIPPGYTFVKKHERGDINVGNVVGYLATSSAVDSSELSE